MSYEYQTTNAGMGTVRQLPPGMLCTVEEIRAAHIAQLDEGSQSHAPAIREKAAISREAMALTDEQLAARRTAAREEEDRLETAIYEARGDEVLQEELRLQLTRVRNEFSALTDDWSRRERERNNPELCAQLLREQQEVEGMWTSGQWRDHEVYNRWLNRSFIQTSPFYSWFASAHCAVVGPTIGEESRCAGHKAPDRLKATAYALLPFATGYYAWRKKDGSLPWTAGGAAAGIVVPWLLWWVWLGAMMLSGKGPAQY